MRAVHAVAVAAVTTSALAVCCGWPYEVGTPPAITDAETPETEDALNDTPGYDVPTALCSDGGLRSGEAIACACGDADVDAEGGINGQQTCTLEGGLGACVGCPATSTCDGVTSPASMICVPGGVTTLGAKNAEVCPPEGCPLEGPLHSVAVTRFFLDEREVTVKRFRDWWAAGHVTPKAGDAIFTSGDGIVVTWRETWTATQPTLGDAANGGTWPGETSMTNDALPINFVDFPTALAFCMANGARLPTEAEWELAASGREGRLFPREAAETRNAAPTAAMLPCARALSAVGGDCGPPAAPSGTTERYSRDGVYDLIGSLAEWVMDVPPPGGSGCTTGCYPAAPSVDPVLFVAGVDQHGVRGGAWTDSQPAALRVQARTFKPASTMLSTIGFRCARR